MIRAVLFDVGGVLDVGSGTPSTLYKDLYRNVANFLGTELSSARDETGKLIPRFQRGEINEVEFWKELSYRLKAPLPRNYLGVLQEWYSKKFSLNHGMLDLAATLKINGYQNAIISNTIDPHTRVWKPYVEGQFLSIIASSEVGIRKPEEGIYIYVVRSLKLEKQEGVFIDDNEDFLPPAEKAGLVPLLFVSTEQVRSELMKLGVKVD